MKIFLSQLQCPHSFFVSTMLFYQEVEDVEKLANGVVLLTLPVD